MCLLEALNEMGEAARNVHDHLLAAQKRVPDELARSERNCVTHDGGIVIVDGR